MSFSKDLAVGRAGEEIALEIFQRNGVAVSEVPKELRRWYDFSARVRGKDLQVECKYDLRANRTENMAIEVGNTKTQAAAGIMLTKADIWCHVFAKDSVWICDVPTLRMYVETCPFGFVRKVVAGGDGNADLVLLKKGPTLNLLFTEISQLGKEQFLRLLSNIC
jgi:hypothetical protein